MKKKPRLSSPEHVDQNSSQEHTDAPDISFVQPKLGFAKATAFLQANVARPSNPNDDPDNPFTNQAPPNFGKASSILPGFGFASASSIKYDPNQFRGLSPSPGAPPEHNYDAWFGPLTDIAPVGFQTAASASSSSIPSQATGFVSLGSKSVLAPSAAALAKAREKLKEIWDENPEDTENVDPLGKPKEQFAKPTLHALQPTLQRPALQPLNNGFQTPGTPTPASFSYPTTLGNPPAAAQPKMKQKPFRSPLIRSTPGVGPVSSPPNPKLGFSSAANIPCQRAQSSVTPSTPLKPGVSTSRPPAFHTPIRGLANIPRSTPAPFVTPFKTGMRPGEPGWTKLQESIRKGGSQSVSRSPAVSLPSQLNPSRQLATKKYKTFFDLRGCLTHYLQTMHS